MSTAPATNPLEMSDADFSNMSGPPAAPTAEETAAAEAAAEAIDKEDTSSVGSAGSDDNDGDGGKADDNDAGQSGSGSAADGDKGDADDTGAVADADNPNKDKPAEVDPKLDDKAFIDAGKPKPAAKVAEKTGDAAGTQGATDGLDPTDKSVVDASKDGKASDPDVVVAEPDEATLKTMYHKIMTPFKANGKMVTLKDPDEAIQLMQMGANYTRKMQELQPHRKLLMMLQSNDLDESKLSYLIDLDKKNPEAIKKLIKDSGIDPLDIDITQDPGYKPGVHELTDNEVAFRTTLDDLSQTSEGRDFITEVNNKFDESSKEVLWKQPEIMAVLNSQRETGVYAMIAEEMERQITLGTIPTNMPFLEAYKTVGDQLSAQVAETAGTLEKGTDISTEQAGKPAPVVVATRVAAPKVKVANGEKVGAASTTRSTPSTKEPLVNPLAMADDEFMKKMAGRV